jgi:hypothetical protein
MKNMFYAIALVIFLQSTLYLDNCSAQWALDTVGLGYKTQQSLAVSGNNIYAGTMNNGVYLSTNNGTSWSQTSLNNQYIYSLAVNGSNVYAGTYGNGVFLSTNNGTTWTQTTLINKYVPSLLVVGTYIYAGVYYDGVYLSTNNGATWTQTTLNNRDVYSLAYSGTTLFAGTFLNGVYVSANNGSTWTQTTLNNQSIQSLFVNGTNIFAGTYYSAGIYLSTNNGVSWTPSSISGRSFYSFAASGNTIFAGSDGYGVYTSVNNGANWIQRNEGFIGGPRVFGLCILNGYIFAGTDYNLFRRPVSELIGIKTISEHVPTQFSLGQNYPNPFNPNTVIRFQLSVVGMVSLKVYDATGREVLTLVNESLKPGTYETSFNGSLLNSGVYFYKLITDGFSETKRMLLIK